MSEKAYICDFCKAALPSHRARVSCRICPDYNSLCADCHFTECVSGTHCVDHDYEVYIQGRRVLVKSTCTSDKDISQETPLQTSSPVPDATSETYWGRVITAMKTASPIFSRLIAAIFAQFDAASAGILQPSEFCALMIAAGYSAEEFPPITVATNESASPADLHQLDAWLADWFQSVSFDHRMETREFPPPPPVEPHNGRIRWRDQFLHSLMHPPAPVVPNGLPVLSRKGLEQYFVYQVLLDPTDAAARLNHLLGALPRLTDPETGRPFETQLIPRACLSLIPDPEEQEKRRTMERQASETQHEMLRMRAEEVQANYEANMAITTALTNVGGGWRTDWNGERYYDQGFIR